MSAKSAGRATQARNRALHISELADFISLSFIHNFIVSNADLFDV
jgi:hypothetical protein